MRIAVGVTPVADAVSGPADVGLPGEVDRREFEFVLDVEHAATSNVASASIESTRRLVAVPIRVASPGATTTTRVMPPINFRLYAPTYTLYSMVQGLSASHVELAMLAAEWHQTCAAHTQISGGARVVVS
jgi:hypothetical protein